MAQGNTGELKQYLCFTEVDTDNEQANDIHQAQSMRRTAQRQAKHQLALPFGEDNKQGMIRYYKSRRAA